jgi:hypothetical protein
MARTGLASSRSILSLAAVAAVAAIAPSAATAAAPTTCTKVAAPTGSDSAAGTEAAPFKTVQKLTKSLASGQTGCLRAGTYGGSDIFLDKPDTGLQSYPGERATLTTFLEVTSTAPRSRVSGLKIDTTGHSNSVGTKLQADDVVFSDNEVTKGGQGICVLAGTYNPAQRIVIERNVIYNCGAAVKPDGSKNKFDHQIYLSGTRNAIVRWNVLRDNPGGWGVHMYPNADGTLVEHNVIDGNQGGVIFAGSSSSATSDSNTVRNNVITGSNPRWNVEGSWSGSPGSGNSATNNCVYSSGPGQPSGIATQSGFSATSNTVLAALPYADKSTGDYRFKSGSACANLVGDVLGAIAGRASAPVEPAPTPPPATVPDPGMTIIIRADRRKVSLPRSVRVKGRIKTRESVDRVKLQVKTRKGNWRTIARRSVHNRRFKAKLRGTQLRRVRVARLRAVVPGKAKSHIVRVKVTRRAHR